MSSEIQTFFVRHTEALLVDQETKEWLWDNSRVAIHYPHSKGAENEDPLGEEDNPSLDPKDYPDSAAQSAIRTLNELAAEGGYVCAEFAGKSEVLVGKVPPGTKVELVSGTWEGNPEREARLKAVPLEQVQTVGPVAYASLKAGRPRQGTICRWHKVGDGIKRLVEGGSQDIRLGDLTTELQEVLCYEYLRKGPLPENLPHLETLLLPIGRTLPDLDILGLDAEGSRVWAQVTYGNLAQSQEKAKALRDQFDGEGSRILFCGEDQRFCEDGVWVIPLREVFDWMKEGGLGQEWIRQTFPGLVPRFKK